MYIKAQNVGAYLSSSIYYEKERGPIVVNQRVGSKKKQKGHWMHIIYGAGSRKYAVDSLFSVCDHSRKCFGNLT